MNIETNNGAYICYFDDDAIVFVESSRRYFHINDFGTSILKQIIKLQPNHIHFDCAIVKEFIIALLQYKVLRSRSFDTDSESQLIANPSKCTPIIQPYKLESIANGSEGSGDFPSDLS